MFRLAVCSSGLRAPLVALGATFLVSIVAAQPAAADGPIVGDVEGGEFRPFPIAVPEIRVAPGSEGAKAAAGQISKIIRDDLNLSGAFKVLDPKAFIDTDGITLSTVRFPDWLNVGAAGLVKAQLRDDGGKLSVELHGFEVAAAKEGLTKNVS